MREMNHLISFKRLNVQSEKLEHGAAETQNFIKCFKQQHLSPLTIKQQPQDNSSKFSNNPYPSSEQHTKSNPD